MTQIYKLIFGVWVCTFFLGSVNVLAALLGPLSMWVFIPTAVFASCISVITFDLLLRFLDKVLP